MKYRKEKKEQKHKWNRRRKIQIILFLILLLCAAWRGLGNGSRFPGGMKSILTGAIQKETSSRKIKEMLSSGEEYPKRLIKLAENNPETIDFVKNYPQKKGRQDKIEVSGDLNGGIPLFLQWDERWGYRLYGGDFMALNGCGPTCLSMVWCGLTGETKWNPYKVARMAEKKGYYVKGAGTAWELMTSGAETLGLSVENLSLDETQILDRLQRGEPVICVVGPGDFTTQGHFLVLTGVDENGKIILHDPNSRQKSNTAWDLETLMPQIRNLWAYHL